MKSYLSLIPISEKVRKRQNIMTILCIMFSVFLVTAIFSMADMMIRTESDFMVSKHGNWHIIIKGLSQDTAEQIKAREDVAAVGAVNVVNYNGELPYRVNEKRAVLYGIDETYMKQIFNGMREGAFPGNDDEVILSPNAAKAFSAKIGESVTLHTPAGDKTFTVSGFGTEDKSYYENQTYLVGVYMTQNAFNSLMKENGVSNKEPDYYIQFEKVKGASKAESELISQYQLSVKDIEENTGVMGMAGQSSKESMKNIYEIAVILFVLVLLAGVLMIQGSMNSNVAKRTQFFGMMRCVGASRGQVIRFVRLEALNWCKTAIPVGVVLGTVVNWGICGVLHYGIGGEFSTTPVFKISPAGVISGVVVGIVTVLLAAQSPAKKAAKVSPMMAVSGNTENKMFVRRAVKTRFGKIENLLGIHHAIGTKKNWVLMTASFALTIILIFSFSVMMNFAQLLMPSLNVTSADFTLTSYSNKMIIDRDVVDQIKDIKGVSKVYGSSYASDIPVASDREGIDHVNMVSYDDTLLDYAKGNIVEGSLDEVYGDSNKVATVFNKNNSLKVGDTISIGGTKLEISCALSQGLFGDDLILIGSQQTFDRLMGKTKYGLIGVQLNEDATEETAEAIRSFESDDIIVGDQRKSNQNDYSTFWASRIMGYGFLTVIGIISLFNIVNSISMSVSARTKQYGAMRAVGMDGGQLNRMIFAEALTYSISGLVIGCGVGLPLSRFLHQRLITKNMGIAWSLPVGLVIIVIIFVLVSSVIAVSAPAKRIRNMEITETISEL